MKPAVKYLVIYRHKEKYSISEMCHFLAVSRSGYYDFVKRIEIDWIRFGQLYGEWTSKSITGRDFMRRMGLSANTFYRRVREYEAEHGIAEPTSA